MAATLLIQHGIVVTMDRGRRILEDGAILIEGNRVVDVDATDVVVARNHLAAARPDRVIDARGKAVIPGIVNAHCHSDVLRGVGDHLPLYEWHAKYADGVSAVLTPDDVYLGVLSTFAEALRSGTTCALCMGHGGPTAVRAAEEVGLRTIMVPYVSERGECSDSFEDNVRMVETYGDRQGRVQAWFAFDSFRDASPELIKRIAAAAERYDVGLHTHSSEARRDVELCQEMYGKRAVEFLHDLGVLSPRMVLAHCVWLDDREIQMLAETGTRVAHCPTSNMKLADGAARLPEMLQHGVTVGIGTDGKMTNNNLDMIEQLKLAVLLQRVTRLDASVLQADDVFELATLGGARTLRLEDQIGSLEAGKKADVVLVSLDRLHLTPLLTGRNNNVISQLVYSASGQDVDTVLVDGQIVVEGGHVRTIDEADVMRRVNAAAAAVLERAGL